MLGVVDLSTSSRQTPSLSPFERFRHLTTIQALVELTRLGRSSCSLFCSLFVYTAADSLHASHYRLEVLSFCPSRMSRMSYSWTDSSTLRPHIPSANADAAVSLGSYQCNDTFHFRASHGCHDGSRCGRLGTLPWLVGIFKPPCHQNDQTVLPYTKR